jgi:hypothetical protein
MKERFGSREVLTGIGLIASIAIALHFLYPSAGAAAQEYITQFDETGILVLNGTEPVSLSITQLVAVRREKLSNISREDGDFMCLDSREAKPKLSYLRNGQWDEPEVGGKHARRSQDLSCYRMEEKREARSLAVTKSFSGQVLIMENPDFVAMCFTGGFLCSWRTFVDGNLVESDDYIAD